MALIDNLVVSLEIQEGSGSSLTDAKGNLAASTVSGGFGWGTDGPTNSAAGVDLNGTTGQIALPADTDLNVTGDKTFEIWCKRDGTSDVDVLVSLGRYVHSDSRQKFYQIAIAPGTGNQLILECECEGGSGRSSLTSTVGIGLSALTQVVVTWNHTTRAWAARINDVDSGGTSTTASTGQILATSGTNTLGVNWATSGSYQQWLNGSIYLFRQWDRILSGAEITELYNGGAAKSYSDLSGGASKRLMMMGVGT